MSAPAKGDARLVAACEELLEGLAQLGVETLPPPAPAAAPATAPLADAPAPSLAPVETLAAIAERIAACRACGLCEARQQTVPGEGSPRARVMFVGEAPGADEDRSGRPFVGRAGQLLTRIIEGGMGLRREEVFIANVLKCRPPENRDPSLEEKAACTPFLEEQIAALQPELIIALGRHAAGHLLGRQDSLGRMRGDLHRRPQGGPPVLVTFHPAYLLRDEREKAACWQDIQMGMRHLGIPLPQRPG